MTKEIKENRKYHISDTGVITNKHGKKMSMFISKTGFKTCIIQVNGRNRTKQVHRVVYEAFIGKIALNGVVAHIDGNRLNNCATNLKQITFKEAHKHQIGVGGVKKKVKVTDVNGNVTIYKSQTDASLALNVSPSSINRCANGYQYTSKGNRVESI